MSIHRKNDSFWPLDTDTKIYLESNSHTDLGDLIRICQEKWPNVKFEQLFITAENIHTDCIYYDLHDAADWTNFMVIEKIT